jgi:hypothetical protein
LEDDTHSFVVRIWHEAVDQEGKPTAWRGYVDHIASGKRHYFTDLKGVVSFMEQQLEWKTVPPSRWQSFLAKLRHEKD